jgi:pseudouridine kinase
VAVIGTVFVDCKGFAGSTYLPLGRNLGRVRFVHGGVGRNVAENLALLNCQTYFVSTVDDSALGREVADRLGQAGVKLDYLSFVRDGGMGMWLAVMDQNGDLAGSISQMPDLGFLEELIDKKGREIIEEATHVVLELDLNERISRKAIELARISGKRIYGIPGNLDVVMHNRDLLRNMDCFICNDIEIGRLLGTSLAGLGVGKIQDILVAFTTGAGLQSMVITLGERGSVYYDAKTGEKAYQPALKTEVVDSSGAGDAFFSGTVAGLIRNLPLGKAVVLGTRLASLTIQSEENTAPVRPIL